MPDKKTVLIIDDELGICEYLQFLLSESGYSTIVACDGTQGISLAQSNPLYAVLCDLVMPGKEGIETIIFLRKLFPDVKIIAMSGVGNKDMYMELALVLGANATISKPFKGQDILSLLKE